jgi:hypothetical protein
LAPYICRKCGTEEEKLLDVGQQFTSRDPKAAPTFACAKCGGSVELDDIPERYLAFLAER